MKGRRARSTRGAGPVAHRELASNRLIRRVNDFCVEELKL